MEQLNHLLFAWINATPASPEWLIDVATFLARDLIIIVPALIIGLWLWGPQSQLVSQREVVAKTTIALLFAMLAAATIGMLLPHERPFVAGVGYTFLALQDKPNCKVILCGGEFRPNNYIFTAVGRHNELDHICPNIAFISAAGLSLQHGATCFNFDELEMKHRALKMSQQKILVADHSKFGKTKPACIGPLTHFDRVITDRQPDPQFAEFFTENAIAIRF